MFELIAPCTWQTSTGAAVPPGSEDPSGTSSADVISVSGSARDVRLSHDAAVANVEKQRTKTTAANKRTEYFCYLHGNPPSLK